MTSNLFSLEGKGVLVTGAHRGIGLAIAREMGRAGARVVISSLDAAGLEDARSQLEQEGIEALAITCDVGDDQALDRLTAGSESFLGRIDVLSCNAGINPHFGSLTTATDEEYDAIMRINLRSTVQLCNRVIPGMAARRDGAVILTSSISGLRGNGMIGVYALSKAAVAQLARNYAVEFGPSNVRTNAISPGLIDTEFARPITANPEILEPRLLKTPLRRVGTVEEVAGAAVFLASAAGAFVNGHNLVVDGGTTIGD
jgi:NAD(P)-dependent dehydrogenase (short-subunit alcohol dehydrogenase family)